MHGVRIPLFVVIDMFSVNFSFLKRNVVYD